MKALSLFILSVSLLCVCSCRGDPPVRAGSDQDTRTIARRASVQTVFHVPVMHISFSTPLPEPEEFTSEDAKRLLEETEEALEEKLKRAIEKFEQEYNEDRWESSLTNFEEWNYEPRSKTFIPLGAFTPKGVKFPERVLLACKVEKKEVDPWKAEYLSLIHI